MSDRLDFLQSLEKGAARLGCCQIGNRVGIEDRCVELMWRHFELLREANKEFNLTRITDPCEAALKHYADSLALLPWVDRSASGSEEDAHSVRFILDVGTGGGFPAVVLASARNWSVVAIDKTAKKARFVRQCAETLDLDNLFALHARLPEWQPELLFDLAVFRAVGTTRECLETAGRTVRPGGWAVCYKTSSAPREESDEARRWCAAHGWAPMEHFDYALHPGECDSPRRLVPFRRIS